MKNELFVTVGEVTNMTFAEKLKSIRKQVGLLQEQFQYTGVLLGNEIANHLFAYSLLGGNLIIRDS